MLIDFSSQYLDAELECKFFLHSLENYRVLKI